MPTLSVYEEGFANIFNSVYSSSHLFYNSFLKSTGLNKWNYSLPATICFFLDRQPDDPNDLIGKIASFNRRSSCGCVDCLSSRHNRGKGRAVATSTQIQMGNRLINDQAVGASTVDRAGTIEASAEPLLLPPKFKWAIVWLTIKLWRCWLLIDPARSRQALSRRYFHPNTNGC